jgi:stearoyl-CoA desaturase (delta-9 desaturase)
MSLLWMFLITVVIMQASVFVTTIYLHRAQTHRGLELHPFVSNLMHLELVLFTGIVTREWVAVHRKHHHFSDKEGDPHSPYLFGMWNVLFNNFFMYRKETKNEATIRKYTPDYKPDLIDKFPVLDRFGIFMGLGIFMLMFGPAWGLGAFLFQAVGYIFLNASINSICHMVGYRNFDNLATNHQFIALLTGGEGLHNNHHEHPSSAKFALRAKEIDPAWPVIWLLQRFGLAEVRPEPLAKAA